MFSQLGNVKKYTNLSEKLSKRNKETPKLALEPTIPVESSTKDLSLPSLFSREEKKEDEDLDIVDIEEEDETLESEKKKEELPEKTSKSILPSTSIFSSFSNLLGTGTSSSKEKDEEVDDEEKVEEIEVEEEEEEEKEFILDKPDYTMQGVPYHYLNDTDDFMNSTLTREWIESLQETGTSEIEIQVALYKWNGAIHHVPFVTYLLEKQSDMYAFPRFTIPISKDKDDKNDDEDSLNEDILNYTCDKECKKRIFHHLHIRPSEHFLTSKTIEHIVFKGYITREKGNEILAVFETKSELPDIRENCQWVTLHEMINTKFVHSYTIHPLVSTWFLENSALIYMKDKFGQSVDIPYVLYLLEDSESLKERKEPVEKSESLKERKEPVEEPKSLGGKQEKESASIFDNLPSLPTIFSSSSSSTTQKEENGENSKNKNKTSTKSKYRSIETDYGLLPSPIHHPNLGKIFLFSEKGTEVARNVVFITNTVYLLDQPPDFSLYRKKTFDSIYFQEDGEVRWGVRNALYFTNQF
jgi:hypothetical protein